MKKIIYIIAAVCLALSLSACKDQATPEDTGTPVMPSSSRVVGFVHCGSEMLADVIVTDGFKFTKTNAGGMFNFMVTPGAEYVSIVTPSGYTADFSSGAPAYYQKISSTASYDFNLQKLSDSDDYTFVVFTDPQTKNEEQFQSFIGEPLDDIVKVCKDKSASAQVVGINLGDVVGDAYDILPKYKEQMKKTGVPFYAVIGNHDHNSKNTGIKAADDFKKVFGPLNFAFYVGKDLVIGLNTIRYNGNKQFDEAYSEETQNFAVNLLSLIPKDTHIYVAQHIPFHRWYEENCIEGGEKVLAALEGYKVDFITGHTHVNNTLTLADNVMDHNIAGFLGAWWYTDWCRDGSPRGYKIFDNKGGKLTWIYHSVMFGEGAEGQGETISPGQSRLYPNSVEINLWDVDDQWTVKWSQGGGAAQAMAKVADYSPWYSARIAEAYPGYTSTYNPSKTPHVFKADPDLNAGNVKIEVTNRFGQTWTYDVPVK